HDSVGAAITLKGSRTITSDQPPQGWADSAAAANSVLVVSGWAIDFEDTQATRVDVLVDGAVVGSATLGLSRPDVAAALGDARFTNSGWSLSYNIASLASGAHTVSAVAYDSAGVTTILRGRPI